MATRAHAPAHHNGTLVKWLLGLAAAGILALSGMTVANRVQLSALQSEREWLRQDIQEMKTLLREIDRRIRGIEMRQ